MVSLLVEVKVRGKLTSQLSVSACLFRLVLQVTYASGETFILQKLRIDGQIRLRHRLVCPGMPCQSVSLADGRVSALIRARLCFHAPTVPVLGLQIVELPWFFVPVLSVEFSLHFLHAFIVGGFRIWLDIF